MKLQFGHGETGNLHLFVATKDLHSDWIARWMVSALGKWKWWRSAFNFGRVCAKLYQTAGKRATLSTAAADDRGRRWDRKHRDTVTEIYRIRVFMTILLCHLTVSPKVSSSHSCCPRWRVKQDCGRGKSLAHWATEFVFAGDACWPPTAEQYYLFKDSYDKAWSTIKGIGAPLKRTPLGLRRRPLWTHAALDFLSACLRLQPLRVWDRK